MVRGLSRKLFFLFLICYLEFCYIMCLIANRSSKVFSSVYRNLFFPISYLLSGVMLYNVFNS